MRITWTLFIFIFTFFSCGNIETTESAGDSESATEESPTDSEDGEMMSETDIQLLKMQHSPLPDQCKLTLTSPRADAQLNPGEINFEYDVKGFDLKAQSELADTIDIVSSDKGQHIHAILNNNPYMAWYEPSFKKDLEPGHYVLLSFLSRSHHESLKTESASTIMQFTVGETADEAADLNAPHMFYSRPKGEYDISKNKDILLDFYLVNCSLSEGGYHVKAIIDGNEFVINEWSPYIIRGLEAGTHTITLELHDGEENLVESPFNPVTREIILVSNGA